MMNIVAVVRLVPDLVEQLVVNPEEDNLDWDQTALTLNESDDHALEEALLLKEKHHGQLTVVAFDCGEIDQVLYMAVAKGADRIIKIAWPHPEPPNSVEMVGALGRLVPTLQADLVVMGCQSQTEFLGMAAAQLAASLGWPYVGVVRGVQNQAGGGRWKVFKEYPGAVLAEMEVQLPAVMGILTASQPPRYVPVSRIRAASQTARFETIDGMAKPEESAVNIRRVYLTPDTSHAEMLKGTEEEVARRLVDLLVERGVLK